TADLLEELDDDDALEAVEDLSAGHLADLLDEMEPDEAADLLGDMPRDQADIVLEQMEDADEVRPLLGYPDETAGGLMTTSFVALRRQTTAEQAIQFLREISPTSEIPYYLYVVDREQKLTGVVGFRELVISSPQTTMQQIMDPDVISVSVGVDQEEVARQMSHYSLASIPVTDARQRLVGVITHDDILEVIEDEATEDIYRLANVSDTELEPDSPLADQVRGRLPWLFLNMLTALFASWVVSNFESLIGEIAILAAFQSVVAGLGGNSGSQNIVMMVRALALDRIDKKKIWNILGRQVLVGLLQGVVVGSVVAIVITVLRGDFHLGLILLLAMTANMVVAAVVGTLVPLFLARIGKDPAVASTILLTAATDSFGFFIFLSLASLFVRFFDI
ncbi:MAG TPA: magnesium transporter, partial [Anaerolineales bacterium]|nr:magnesium transporter [Anaerolineales bacterium]